MLQSIRLAIRRLRHSPGFAALAILTLALGIGANTTIFTAINTTVLRPLPVDHPEQLVFLNRITGSENAPTQSYPNYRDLRDRNNVFSGLMAYSFVPVSFSANGNNNRVWGYLATGNYFDVLGDRRLPRIRREPAATLSLPLFSGASPTSVPIPSFGFLHFGPRRRLSRQTRSEPSVRLSKRWACRSAVSLERDFSFLANDS